MSSFIVDKREFVKAAGLMYGFEASKGDGVNLYWLNSIRQKFNECYIFNVKSVNEQYGEDYSMDEDDYEREFVAYGKMGMNIRSGNGQISLNQLRLGLMKFFGSVTYQIENKEMCDKVEAFFFECVEHLFSRELHYTNSVTNGWWGEIGI